MVFDYLARGIIFKAGMVLLARQKGSEHTFLPGGHIGMGERAEAAIKREILEELGEKACVKQFIGAVECTWSENGQDHQEINLVFEVDIQNLDPSTTPTSREAHLEFIWAKLIELEAYKLCPIPLIECLMSWESGYHTFWGSSIV